MIKVEIPSKGVSVNLPPLGVSGLQMQLMRSNPKPKPPTQIVKIAGKEQEDVNPFHPDYLEAVRMWEEDIQTKVGEFIFRKIAYAQALTDQQKQDVAEFRELFSDLLTIPENDKLAWFYNFALPDAELEVQQLIESAKTQRNCFLPIDEQAIQMDLYGEPEQEAVEAYRDSFPS